MGEDSRPRPFPPVPRRDGYNTLDFVPKSCASRSLWTPSAVYGMSGNVRYFRGRACPSIYRTYRTLLVLEYK